MRSPRPDSRTAPPPRATGRDHPCVGAALVTSYRGSNGERMSFLAPPISAAWSHQDARSGFEVVYLQPLDGGHLLTGVTTAVEDGRPWIVDYEIRVDAAWRTRSGRVTGRFDIGSSTRVLEADGEGRWSIDDEPAPHLDGCLDVDLESSALTNALPVHRLGLGTGSSAQAPAAYVQVLDL